MSRPFAIKIHGNRTFLRSWILPFRLERNVKLNYFTRHYLQNLNLWADFYFYGNSKTKDRILGLLKKLGEYLKSKGVDFEQKSTFFLLLPLENLRLRNIGNKIVFSAAPKVVYIAAMHKRGEFSEAEFVCEVLKILTLKENDEFGMSQTAGICEINALQLHFGKEPIEAWGFNFALTEYVAGQICKELGLTNLKYEYESLVEGAAVLAENIGFETIFRALFDNDISIIVDALDKRGIRAADMLRNIMSVAHHELEQLRSVKIGQKIYGGRSITGNFKKTVEGYFNSINS